MLGSHAPSGKKDVIRHTHTKNHIKETLPPLLSVLHNLQDRFWLAGRINGTRDKNTPGLKACAVTI